MGALRNPTIPNLQIIFKKEIIKIYANFPKKTSLGPLVWKPWRWKNQRKQHAMINRESIEASVVKLEAAKIHGLLARLWISVDLPPFFLEGGGSTKMPGMKWGGGIQKTKRWFPLWLGFVYGKSPFFAPPFGMCFFVTGIPKHLLHGNPRWFLHQTFGWFFLNDSGTWGYWQWAKTNHGEAPLDEM